MMTHLMSDYPDQPSSPSDQPPPELPPDSPPELPPGSQPSPPGQPPAYDQYGQPYPPGGYGDPNYAGAAMKHSRLGIASCILGIIFITLLIVANILALMVAEQYPDFRNMQVQPGEPPPTHLIKPLMMIAVPGCSGFLCGLIGLILGVIALFQSTRRKLYGIIGTVINGVGMFTVCCVGPAINMLSGAAM